MKRRDFLISAGVFGITPFANAIGHRFEIWSRRLIAADKTVCSGISNFDKLKGGFHPGELTVIAARPSVGKTTFAVTLANHLIAETKTSSAVNYYSIEISKEQLMLRFLAQRADLPLWKVRLDRYNDDEFKRLVGAAAQFSDASLYIDDAAGISPGYIRRQLIKNGRGSNRAVIVDYLQLMNAEQKAGNRDEEMKSILRDLKSIAVEYKIPVIALAQLNRKEELDVTGAFDSFIVMTRDSYYARDVRPDEDLMRFRVLTNKHGGVGWADCDWSRESLKIG